jgi:hypothetical protein
MALTNDTSALERLAKINEAMVDHRRRYKHTPQTILDRDKIRGVYENGVKEAQRRLGDHKLMVHDLESKYRLRGVDEHEIQKSVHESFSVMHVQLLAQVILAKKTLAMMDMGTMVEMTRQKIAILEELALEPPK